MTIKIELRYVDNKKYIENQKKQKESFKRIKALHSALGFVDRQRFIDLNQNISSYLKNERVRLKKIPETNKRIREFDVKSDREWKVFPEFIDSVEGCTRYGTSVEDDYLIENDTIIRFKGTGEKVSVNTSYPYQPGLKAKEQIDSIRDKALKHLRESRKKSQTIPFIERDFTVKGVPFPAKYKVYASGPLNETITNNYNLHFEKGEILRLQKLSQTKEVFQNKVPMSNAPHVGIEIEFISKSDKMKLAELLCKENVHKFVCLHDDNSLRNEKEYPHKHEVCIVAPEALINEVLLRVTRAIEAAESKVNWRCGMHVHIDMRNRDVKHCFNNLVRSQNMLYSMNPVSRLTGKTADGGSDEVYSKKVEFSDFDEAMKNAKGDNRTIRYYGINPFSFSKHKTIEVRIHTGTINYTKIKNWVEILLAIVNSSEKYTREVTKLESFIERFKLSEEISKYMQQRIDKFKDSDGKHITIDEAS